ncbi:glycosyl hydrolase [Paenibacillus antri]|uniref:Glycosyl hydrolase n=1 Tax=Paenibacillus antri TaxID=2582848 RepID=A0A5R9GC46_9BACL|nr:glycosyl hydrolase [Paenibacillus antri]
MNSSFREKAKRLAAVTLAACAGLCGSATAMAQAGGPAEQSVTILLDDYPLPLPLAPTIVDGTTMVPFRAISEALGITVEWQEETRSIAAADPTDGKVVELTLGSNVARVGGIDTELRVAPMSVDGSTLIPLAFFSQQFGANVSWDAATRTVSIDSPPRQLRTMAFYAISSFREAPLASSFDAVAFGWGRLDESSNFTLEGKDFYWPEPAGDVTPQSLVDGVTEQGRDPYFMVFASDAAGELTAVLEDETLAEGTIERIVDTAAERRFSGVLLDFEGLGLTGDAEAVQESYNSFVRKLDSAADARGLRLAVAVHPPNGAYRGYDYKTLATLSDEMIVMAYAYEGEKGPEPMKRVDEAIRRTLNDVPAEKLLLGISMGSENADSLGAKIGLAKRYGLRGIAMWRLGLIGEEASQVIRAEVRE